MRIELEKNKTLWQALADKGIVLHRPCGGRGICNGCRIEVEGVGRVRSCCFTGSGSCEVHVGEQLSFTTVFAQGTQENGSMGEHRLQKPFLLADVGTTTVALAAVWKGWCITGSFVNPQRSFGADVFSRISACAGDGGRLQKKMLWDALGKAVASAIDELEQKAEAEREKPPDDWRLLVGGNTTMIHIMLGYSCEGLGRAPFTPTELRPEVREIEIGERRMPVHVMPGISAFIGGDIVSGMYGMGMGKKKRPVLFMDLGTNGEIALGDERGYFVASAAAGPALESGDLAIKLHASGIFRLLNRLLGEGIIDGYGTLAEPWFDQGYPAGQGVLLTQEDIRQIQMAKGAIAAAVRVLIAESKIASGEIAQVYLAGGMGYFLDPADAAAVGLIPRELAPKAVPVGNACMRGLFCWAEEMDKNGAFGVPKSADDLIAGAREVLLSGRSDFEEWYIENMNFIPVPDQPQERHLL